MADNSPSGPEVTPETMRDRAESDEKISYTADKLIADFESSYGPKYTVFARRLHETQTIDVLDKNGEQRRTPEGTILRELCPAAQLALTRARARWAPATDRRPSRPGPAEG